MLLVNGCSFTYGEELEYPSEQNWGAVLGNLRNLDVINLARPGSSNHKIYRDTTKYLRLNPLEDIDLLIIMWSASQRTEYYSYNTNALEQAAASRIQPDNKELFKNRAAWLKFYSDIFTDDLGIIYTLNYINNISWLCHKHNIPLIQTIFHSNERNIYRDVLSNNSIAQELFSELGDNSTVGIDSKYYTIKDIERINNIKGMPKTHPSAECHSLYARYLNSIIEELI